MSLNAIKNLLDLAEFGGKGELRFSEYKENNLDIDQLMDVLAILKSRGYTQTDCASIDLRENDIMVWFTIPLKKDK